MIAAKDVGGIYSFPHGHPYVSGEPSETIATIHPPPPNGGHEAARPDALQAAVESAEVDKVDPMAYSGYDEDPRLLNDAYMQNYTRSIAVSSSLESPTYTQLENAAMSNFNKIHSSSTSTTPSSSTSPSIHPPPPPPLQPHNGSAPYYHPQGYAPKSDVNSIYVQLQGKPGFRSRGYDPNFPNGIPPTMHSELKDGSLAWAAASSPYGSELHRDLGHYAHYVPTAATASYPASSASFEAGIDYAVSIPSSSSGSGHHHSGSGAPTSPPSHCMTCQTRLGPENWRGGVREGVGAALCDACVNYSKINNGTRMAAVAAANSSTAATSGSRGGSKKASAAVIRVLHVKDYFKARISSLIERV